MCSMTGWGWSDCRLNGGTYLVGRMVTCWFAVKRGGQFVPRLSTRTSVQQREEQEEIGR